MKPEKPKKQIGSEVSDHPANSDRSDLQRHREDDAPSARSAAITNAIGMLGQTLHASSMYNAKDPQDSRKITANILIKVIDLVLELWPAHPEWVIPLNQLLYGLKDLDRGKANKLFQPVKLDYRPPSEIADVVFRPIPAAAMTCLVKDGKKRTEAADMIARKLNTMGYRDRSGGAIKGSQVAQWREEAMAPRPKEKIAADRYWVALNEVKEKGFRAQEAVTYLLGLLPSLPPRRFP
jgi:hypothetical protein